MYLVVVVAHVILASALGPWSKSYFFPFLGGQLGLGLGLGPGLDKRFTVLLLGMIYSRRYGRLNNIDNNRRYHEERGQDQ